jgi:transketolase
MNIAATYVWTHDSIGVGEDGPTHQPIEHFAALRAIPGLDVIRPGDANEVAEAWKQIITRGRAAEYCSLAKICRFLIARSVHLQLAWQEVPTS